MSQGIPLRTPLAYAAALALLAGGTLILTRRFALQGACIVGALHGLNVVLLQAPKVWTAPLAIVEWLGFAELLALALAGILLAFTLDARPHADVRRWSCVAFGCCPVVWGLSHFAYPDFTAAMIPAWIPGAPFWAYATGFFHVAAGAGIVTGVLVSGSVGRMLARLAAVMLTIMLGLFTLLVHVTGVVRDPSSRQEWTMIFVATSLTGAAWIFGASLREDRLGSPGAGESAGKGAQLV